MRNIIELYDTAAQSTLVIRTKMLLTGDQKSCAVGRFQHHPVKLNAICEISWPAFARIGASYLSHSNSSRLIKEKVAFFSFRFAQILQSLFRKPHLNFDTVTLQERTKESATQETKINGENNVRISNFDIRRLLFDLIWFVCFWFCSCVFWATGNLISQLLNIDKKWWHGWKWTQKALWK